MISQFLVVLVVKLIFLKTENKKQGGNLKVEYCLVF